VDNLIVPGIDNLDPEETHNDENDEVSPEEAAQILSGKEPAEDPDKDGEKPDTGGKAAGAKPAEETPAGFPKTQAELDTIIKDRLERARKDAGSSADIKALAATVTNLVEQVGRKETRSPLEQGRGDIPQGPDDITDVGAFMEHPMYARYAGWSMAELKQEYPDIHKELLPDVRQKILAMSNAPARQADTAADRAVGDYIRKELDNVIEALGDDKSKYFDDKGQYNDAFRDEFLKPAEDMGIFNPRLAYEMKGAKHHLSDEQLETKLKAAREEGAKGLLKHAGDNKPPAKGANTSGEMGGSLEDKTDEQLSELYDNPPDAETGRKAREILAKRGW